MDVWVMKVLLGPRFTRMPQSEPHCPVQLILLWRLQKLISRPVVVVKRGESVINLPKPLRWKTNITSHESWPLFLHFLPSPHPTFPQSPQASSVVGRLGRGKKKTRWGRCEGGKENFSLFPLSTVYLLLFCIATVFFFIIEIASRSFWGKESTGY